MKGFCIDIDLISNIDLSSEEKMSPEEVLKIYYETGKFMHPRNQNPTIKMDNLTSIKQINTGSIEGRLLMAALAILTTQPSLELFKKEVKGTEMQPDEMLEQVGKLQIEMYKDKDIPYRTGLSFGEAILAAKAGERVARAGWNGMGMFAYIVPADSYPAKTDIAKKYIGEMVPYRTYWALKTAQGDVAAWSPSGSDSLADDWMILMGE